MGTNKQNAYLVYDALKAHPGSSFSQVKALLPDMAEGSVSGCLSKLRGGFRGMRVTAEGPPMAMKYTALEAVAPVPPSRPRKKARRANGKLPTVLLLLPIGKTRSEPVSMDEARIIWETLNPIFGGK